MLCSWRPRSPRSDQPNQSLILNLNTKLDLLHLLFKLDWLEKTSLYLQDKLWTVKTTSMEFGCFPSCTTWFLWFNMVHNVVNMVYIYSIKTTSFKLRETSNSLNHCCTKIFIRSKVCIVKGKSCQQALAKRRSRKRWEVDSSSILHKRHIPLAIIPLFFRRNSW